VLASGDAGYDEARQLWKRLCDGVGDGLHGLELVRTVAAS